MKENLFLFTGVLFLFFSCSKPSKIGKDFNCKTASFNNIEEIKDVKNFFSIKIPKTWKTNFYYDAVQSSIYTADTTKQLTETLLLDITSINQNLKFDIAFKLKQEQNNLSKKLIKKASKEVIIQNKPAYYTISKGKKGKFNYQVGHFFIKINEQKFILAKAEIYGDSLINKRFCNALALIEKIKILY
ncbi:MAG: hypothetical protein ABJH82_07410 [Polaribacter sp.]|uniref:hypothetical protein n=1 Tax=Polaribacter sp. TaxID=1920175 RepID=UPI003266CF17